MLIPFNRILETFRPEIIGVIHIGTGECEELEVYEKHLDREQVLWINPNVDNVRYCRDAHSGLNIVCANAVDINIKQFNFLNIDLPGHELRILDGLSEQLHLIDYVYVEVSDLQVLGELDAYLKKYQLINVETKWWDDGSWADAFYRRL